MPGIKLSINSKPSLHQLHVVPGRIGASPFEVKLVLIEPNSKLIKINWQHYTHVLSSVSILGCD